MPDQLFERRFLYPLVSIQVIHYLIQRLRLLAAMPTDTLRIKHRDPRKAQSHGKKTRIKAIIQANGRRQTHRKRHMRARHATRADQPLKIETLIPHHPDHDLEHLRREPRRYGRYKDTISAQLSHDRVRVF